MNWRQWNFYPAQGLVVATVLNQRLRDARPVQTSAWNASLHRGSHDLLVSCVAGARFYVRGCAQLEHGRAELLVATPAFVVFATARHLGGLLSEVSRPRIAHCTSMKSLLLFVLNLAAVACALRAASLIFSVKRVYVAPNSTQLAWKMSEASGFMTVGCFCAFAALIAAVFAST
jgi:hypothetical protein